MDSSMIPVLVGGAISIVTQIVVTNRNQKNDNKRKIRDERLIKYSSISKWICNYDAPKNHLDSIHSSWLTSREKYIELRSLRMDTMPYVSINCMKELDSILEFWKNDLSTWKGGHRTPEIADRIICKSEEYEAMFDKLLAAIHSDILRIEDRYQ